MQQFDVPPLNITAAPARAKALVICAKGEVEISLASKFAEQSKGAGASVLLCPPDVEYICDHAKTAAGTYDVVVVESAGAEGSSGVVLGEVGDDVLCIRAKCSGPPGVDGGAGEHRAGSKSSDRSLDG